MLDPPGDVGKPPVHVGKRPQIGSLRHPRRKLFHRRLERVDIAVGGRIGFEIVDALVEALHVSAQALNFARRIGGPHGRLSVLERALDARFDLPEFALGGLEGIRLGGLGQLLRSLADCLDTAGKLVEIVPSRLDPAGNLVGILADRLDPAGKAADFAGNKIRNRIKPFREPGDLVLDEAR